MTRPKTQQRYGDLKPMKVALSENIRKASVIDLNRALADTIVLRDLYKKHHWQVTGPTFRELHLLFDEHQAQQGELIDEIAERIMQLGGVSIAMGADAAEESEIPRPPRDREAPAAQLERLVFGARNRPELRPSGRAPRFRAGRRRHQRSFRQRPHSAEREAGLVRQRAPHQDGIG